MQYNYHKSPPPPPQGAPIPPNNSYGGVKQVYILAITAVVFVVLVVLFFTLTSSTSSKPAALDMKASTISKKTKISRLSQTHKAPNIPVDVSSIKLIDDNDDFELDIALSTWTAYRFQFSNEHKTLDLILFNTKTKKDKEREDSDIANSVSLSVDGIRLLGDFSSKGIKVDTFSHNDDLNIIFKFPNSVHIRKSHISKSHPSSLTLSLAKTKEPEVVVLPEVSNPGNKINSLAVDYHDRSEALVTTAQNLLNFGKYDEAISQLKENPVAVYENEQVCEMLAKLYLKKKMYVQAESLASQGVTIFPDSIGIRKIWAQANFSMQNYKKSFSILKSHAPEISTNIEYYSLLASVSLKLQKYEFASGIYRSLLAYKPSNADWWAGLAITLQGLGKNNLALEAYHRAIAMGTLSSDLTGYVQGQIQSLQ